MRLLHPHAVCVVVPVMQGLQMGPRLGVWVAEYTEDPANHTPAHNVGPCLSQHTWCHSTWQSVSVSYCASPGWQKRTVNAIPMDWRGVYKAGSPPVCLVCLEGRPCGLAFRALRAIQWPGSRSHPGSRAWGWWGGLSAGHRSFSFESIWSHHSSRGSKQPGSVNQRCLNPDSETAAVPQT